MALKFKALTMITRSLVWVVITGIWLASSCLAEETGSAAWAIQDITPMTEMSTLNTDIRAEDYFDIVGTLNLIEGNRVIVDDRELKIASGVSTSLVRQWNLVGIKLNTAGDVLVFEKLSDEPH